MIDDFLDFTSRAVYLPLSKLLACRETNLAGIASALVPQHKSASRPADVRARINSRSNLASPAKIIIIKRPWAWLMSAQLSCSNRNAPRRSPMAWTTFSRSRVDTSLLTYRNPIHSTAGPLAVDEQDIKRTSLKDHFFVHLSNLGALGQSTSSRMWTCPSQIDEMAHVETFTSDPANGRAGLLVGKARSATSAS